MPVTLDVTRGSYGFKGWVYAPRLQSTCTQDRDSLYAVFECMAGLRCTSSPYFGKHDWWIGYVQTILHDTVTLHYADGAECTLRSYARRPKDQDLNIGRHIDERISLFDVMPHACQPVPGASGTKPVEDKLGHVKDKQKEWKLTVARKDEAVVLFYDKPAVRIGGRYDVYLDDVATGLQETIGFQSPFSKQSALVRISGGLRFALWLVLMKDPEVVKLSEKAQMFFTGVSVAPLGPRSGPQFDPLYHFVWSVDFSAKVTDRVFTPTGAGMRVLTHGTGAGVHRPTLDGPPATAKMGTSLSMELQEF